MPSLDVETFRGRQLAAARALAGLSVRELAALANVDKDTITSLETRELIEITAKRRHGYVARATWVKITGALTVRGVELFHESAEHGAGVRYIRRDP